MNRSIVVTLLLASSSWSCTSALPLNCTDPFDSSVAAGKKLNAFLGATNGLLTQFDALDRQLLSACQGMAAELGVTVPAPTGMQSAAEAACAPVVARIRENLAMVRAGAGIVVVPDIAPPVCNVSVNAYAQCVGRCDASFTPAMSTLRCEGGEIRGGCSGTCTGSCSATVSGSCMGSCEGTCTTSCTGECRGFCEGMCATRGPDGSCAGACTGTCRGTCSTGCTGSCTGSCVASASASCTGECRGSCSVEFTEPRCTGTVTPPMADVDCRASCNASVNATAECTPATARLVVVGTLSGDAQARFDATNRAITAQYGNVLKIGAQLARIGAAVSDLAEAGQRLGGAVGGLTANAVACTADAALRVRTMIPRVQVTVQVSVSVGASIAP